MEVVFCVEVEVDDVVSEGFHGRKAAGFSRAGGVGGPHVGGDDAEDIAESHFEFDLGRLVI